MPNHAQTLAPRRSAKFGGHVVAASDFADTAFCFLVSLIDLNALMRSWNTLIVFDVALAAATMGTLQVPQGGLQPAKFVGSHLKFVARIGYPARRTAELGAI
jgi:hypothetical protein